MNDEQNVIELNKKLLEKYQTCRKARGVALVTACRDISRYVVQLEPRGNATRLGWAKGISKRTEGINMHALNNYLVIGAGAGKLQGHEDLLKKWTKMSSLVSLVRLPSAVFDEALAFGVLREATTVKDLSCVRVQEQCDIVRQKLMSMKPGGILANNMNSAIPQPLYPRKTEVMGAIADPDLGLLLGVDRDRPLLGIAVSGPGVNDSNHAADALQFTLPLEGADASEVALGIYKQYGSEFAKKVKSLL